MKSILILSLLLMGSFSGGCQPVKKNPSNNYIGDQDANKAVAELQPLDMSRVRQVVQMLPEKPRGFGVPYQNRAEWNKLLETGKYTKVLTAAKGFVNQKLPSFNERTYNALYEGDDSNAGKKMLLDRLTWIVTLTWAECLENKGMYVPTIENALTQIVAQRTWTNVRNNLSKAKGGKSTYNVELSAARYANNLAQCLYLLDDKLSEKTVSAVKTALNQRIFEPVLKSVETGNNDHWWLTGTNNWNAVCLSQVVGAALSTLDSKEERAKFVVIGERYSKNGIAGFSNDGYCSEGVSYYNYGFGHYILLRENIYQATSGKINLFDDPKIKKIAGFLIKMELSDNVYPAISDCPPNTRGDKALLYYLNRNLEMGLREYDNYNSKGLTKDLISNVMYAFPNTASGKQMGKSNASNALSLRSAFEDAGVFTLRPTEQYKGTGLAAVVKGGNNAEHHNHNDVGSVTLAVGNEILMGDPGSIPYTADIFTKARYNYKTIASYGHPVPMVADAQQQTGKNARAIIKETSFTETQDKVQMDLTSAYKGNGLKTLLRTFEYDRMNEGKMIITDEVSFDSPQSFETAIITRAKFTQISDNQILIEGKKHKLLATISSPSGTLSIQPEVIREGGSPYTRIAIRMQEKIASGKISITYVPQAK